MSSLSELQYSVQKICTPLAISINSLLILLILFKSPKNLGIYKYLMIYIALFEITYSVLDVLASPDFFSTETMFLVITQSDKVLVPRWALEPLTTWFCSMFGLSMAVFVLHFIYRYLVITGNRFLKKTTSKKLIIWFLSPILYGFVWGCVLKLFIGSNEHTDEILRKHYFPQRGLTATNVCYYGPNYWIPLADGKETINWKVMLGMFFIIMMVSVSLFIIVYFATMSYKRMSILVESSSRNYRSLQVQLLNSLVAQAFIPLLLMQMPSFLIFTAPFFHMGNDILGGILGITVSLYPVLDPFPTMLIVKHYRNAIFHPFRDKPKRSRLETIAGAMSRCPSIQTTRM